MPLPRKQALLLTAFAVLAATTLAVGAWDFEVAGAVHELVLGVVFLPLIVWARVVGRRTAR